jgi:metal-responsive CopG/Arc/MetJ family transcriptional regulator
LPDKATTIALEPEMDELLSQAAAERGVSRSEFIRQQLALVLEQFRRHPRPKVAGIIHHKLADRGTKRSSTLTDADERGGSDLRRRRAPRLPRRDGAGPSPLS